MSLRVSPVLLLSLLVCVVSVDASAQTSGSSKEKTIAANSEEAAIFDRILNRIRFENDGTEVSETEAAVKIQSQAGVELRTGGRRAG